jgi:hypothetical protein
MGRDLGALVGAQHNLVNPATLLAKWQTNGAIWYARLLFGWIGNRHQL